MSPRPIACILIIIGALLFQPGIAGVTPQSRPMTFEGRLQAAELDDYDEATGVWNNQRVLLLNTAGGDLLELDNPPPELTRAEIGRQIRVTGFLRQQKLVIEHFDPLEYPDAVSEQVLLRPRQQAGPETETLGAQKTLVALCNFSDVPYRPFALDSVRAKILSDANSTDNFLRENSYGKLWLDVDFVDWKTLQANSNQLCPGST